MDASLARILICLLAGIVLIVLLTAKYRVHAFFALVLACMVVGLGVGLPVDAVFISIKEGFGNILKSLGLIIALGTTLGAVLEHTGCTRVMANAILKRVGSKRANLAMSLTGLIVGLPIFCDSGYIVLSGLNKSLARSTGIAMAAMATSLATGLYSVHCLIPPHPGASAAAGLSGVDYGRLILIGTLVAIPAMLVGYFWANYAGKKYVDPIIVTEETENEKAHLPSALKAFAPVVAPILLIAIKAFFVMDNASPNNWLKALLYTGEPAIALAIGILLAFNAAQYWQKHEFAKLLQGGAEKAGGILVIIGAGGAFGAVLAATNIGGHLGAALPLGSMGLLFPFLITFIIKTAQGSSTVAIITAASILLPLLKPLGLDTTSGHLLCVLAMGAGSMMISHANDAYFWVIAKFSGLEMKTMLSVYSVSTILMGLTTFAMVYLLSFIL
nr:GntP family permease [uncultured Mucilaginibacter sp.]